jgi:nitrate reductase gamma subunit
VVGPAELLVLLFILFCAAIGIGVTVFWIWMLIDCAMKESSEGNDKLIWILVILLTHLLGALVYYLVRRPQRIKELGQ